ncbi:MAG: mannitol dehydrogenase family protein [Lachnospiraceae bacterium]|nr:mannitol dehydrogenase family protein [Lachnospiraceae bacterium]
MELKINTLQDDFYRNHQIQIPRYDISAVSEKTKEAPIWVHFGIGNIFRIFIGGLQDKLLNEGLSDRGIVCVETFDYDIVDQIYRPYDNLVLGVTLKADGSTDRRVIGSLSEAIAANSGDTPEWKRLQEIFGNPSLQMVSFTVTEKGYALKGTDGTYLPYILPDLEKGLNEPKSAMAVVTALLYHRFVNGKSPIAVVSMDNCSHNGEKLQNAVLTMAGEWEKRNLVSKDFINWLKDEKAVSFPWTMIDKITPRPDEQIASQLASMGLENMQPVITGKKTYIAPFVNAEGPEYLVVEDCFPNGRPPLEKAGVYFTDRNTVNDVERMKVTTCLNPLHTALAVYGCLLDYHSIAEEMQDEELKKLVYGIGPKEGMEVVCDPGILSPDRFVQEVLTERLPNAFIPDTPQRIATDTSQKVAIRYGETIKSYVAKYGNAGRLHYIPIAIAGWMRYLLGVDDHGEPFELSPDPLVPELTGALSAVRLGDDAGAAKYLRPILSNANIFGSDLYEAGIGEKIEEIFVSEIAGVGAVRSTLQKLL